MNIAYISGKDSYKDYYCKKNRFQNISNYYTSNDAIFRFDNEDSENYIDFYFKITPEKATYEIVEENQFNPFVNYENPSVMKLSELYYELQDVVSFLRCNGN
jgi:hypothetical protein